MPSSTNSEMRHWSKSRRVTALLLGLWFVVTFGVTFFARDLSTALLGWRFSFWMTAQGAVLVYGLLVWWYALWMARLDKEFGLTETH
jgi:putative solute:sodium symporter small subunit